MLHFRMSGLFSGGYVGLVLVEDIVPMANGNGGRNGVIYISSWRQRRGPVGVVARNQDGYQFAWRTRRPEAVRLVDRRLLVPSATDTPPPSRIERSIANGLRKASNGFRRSEGTPQFYLKQKKIDIKVCDALNYRSGSGRLCRGYNYLYIAAKARFA